MAQKTTVAVQLETQQAPVQGWWRRGTVAKRDARSSGRNAWQLPALVGSVLPAKRQLGPPAVSRVGARGERCCDMWVKREKSESLCEAGSVTARAAA